MATPTTPQAARKASVSAIEVESFTRARLSELAALRAAVISGRANRRVHQQLAWHLRRRTLSHSSRRAPVAIRVAHRRELASSGLEEKRQSGPKGSRRLRKYRAKARFLLYFRKLRNARPSRLETHEWHAKRFHMTQVPGRVVADYCNDRGLRSAYRAFTHSSLAHDASYLDIVQMTAPSNAKIVAALAQVLAPVDVARVATVRVASGTRYLRGAVVHDTNSGRTIAPVDVLFRPSCTSSMAWLWVHPAASHAVLDAIRVDSVEDVELTFLSGEVQTMRVYGPRAGFVLGAVVDRCDTPTSAWDVVRHARSPASSPACCVLAGEMLDPRCNFPPKRVRAMAEAASDKDAVRSLVDASFDAFDAVPPVSPIWDAAAREAFAPQAIGKHSAQHVPFLLLQRPGCERGLGASWDIVVPRGWGRHLWHSLMYANGARAIGLKEMKHLALETGECIFPYDYPDSLHADGALREVETKMVQQYERRPKSKRVNYAMYRVHSPFYPDLAAIVAESTDVRAPGSITLVNSEAKPDVSVDKNLASSASGSTSSGHSHPKSNDKKLTQRPLKRRRFVSNELKAVLKQTTDEKKPVFRILRNRTQLRIMLGQHDGSHGAIVESGRHWFARAIVVPMGRGNLSANALVCAPSDADLKKRFTAPKEILKKSGDACASRKCIGRISYGDFSMSRGGPAAIAFVNVKDVCMLLSDVRAVPKHRRGRGRKGEIVEVTVLVRNVESLQYRFAVAAIHF